MASLPVRSMFAFAAATVIITFTSASGATTIDPDSYTYERVPDRVYAAPSDLPRVPRDLDLFEGRVRFCTFPIELVAEPVGRAELAAGVGPGRCSVTPGRASCSRQTVPSRTRRKLRVWERTDTV